MNQLDQTFICKLMVQGHHSNSDELINYTYLTLITLILHILECVNQYHNQETILYWKSDVYKFRCKTYILLNYR